MNLTAIPQSLADAATALTATGASLDEANATAARVTTATILPAATDLSASMDTPSLVVVCVAAPFILLGVALIAFTYYLEWWERHRK